MLTAKRNRKRGDTHELCMIARVAEALDYGGLKAEYQMITAY